MDRENLSIKKIIGEKKYSYFNNLDLGNKGKYLLKYLFRPKKKYDSIAVEYFSRNPTGQISLARARNAVLGSCLVSLLKVFHHKVDSLIYLNDMGTQVLDLLSEISYPIPSLKKIGELYSMKNKRDNVNTLALEKKMENSLETLRERALIAKVILHKQLSEMNFLKLDIDKINVESSSFNREHSFLKKRIRKINYYPPNTENKVYLLKKNKASTYLSRDICNFRGLMKKYSTVYCVVGADQPLHLKKVSHFINKFFNTKNTIIRFVYGIVTLNGQKISTRRENTYTVEMLKEKFKEKYRLSYSDALFNNILRGFFYKFNNQRECNIEINKLLEDENIGYYLSYTLARFNALKRGKLFEKTAEKEEIPDSLIYEFGKSFFQLEIALQEYTGLTFASLNEKIILCANSLNKIYSILPLGKYPIFYKIVFKKFNRFKKIMKIMLYQDIKIL